MKKSIVVPFLALSFLLTACGKSEEQKAADEMKLFNEMMKKQNEKYSFNPDGSHNQQRDGNSH
jgi:hypothetical protein